MAKLKMLVCDCCDKKYVYPKETKWKHIFKIAEKFNWSVGKKDLCPECYKMFLQNEKENVENVQSENNTDCFEKEMTQEEAFKLMQETWCFKCKFLSQIGMCVKRMPKSGRTCLDDFLSNEIPESFEEVEIENLKKLEELSNEN